MNENKETKLCIGFQSKEGANTVLHGCSGDKKEHNLSMDGIETEFAYLSYILYMVEWKDAL